MCIGNGDSLPTIREIKDILYPPRGGLSDFFVWKNDYLERLKLMKKLKPTIIDYGSF